MILVFAEQQNGQFKKASFEALSYGAEIGKSLGQEVAAVVLGECNNPSVLSNYGADKIYHCANVQLNHFSSRSYTQAIGTIAGNASVIIFSDNTSARGIAPRLSVRLKAGLVSGAIALPEVSNGFSVKKNVFSGKAFGLCLMGVQ